MSTSKKKKYIRGLNIRLYLGVAFILGALALALLMMQSVNTLGFTVTAIQYGVAMVAALFTAGLVLAPVLAYFEKQQAASKNHKEKLHFGNQDAPQEDDNEIPQDRT